MGGRPGKVAMVRRRALHRYVVKITQGAIAFCGVAVIWILIMGTRVERFGLRPFVPYIVYGFMGALLFGIVLIAAGRPPMTPRSRGLVAQDRSRYARIRSLRAVRPPPRLPGS